MVASLNAGCGQLLLRSGEVRFRFAGMVGAAGDVGFPEAFETRRPAESGSVVAGVAIAVRLTNTNVIFVEPVSPV